MKTTENSVKELMDLESRTVYLGMPVGNGNDELIDLIPAEEDPQDVEEDPQNDTHLLKDAVENLPERQREIIKAYYGIDCEPMTLLELANERNITRERIRQIKTTALRRVRTHLKFKEYSYN
jgi:RNA polymerase primary sigma factor